MATPTLERIARQIHALEGIEVRVKPLNGTLPTRAPKYDFGRGARNNLTIAAWKRLRFEKTYPDLAVEVVLGNGKIATPATPLERVRRSYEAAPAKAATGTKKQPSKRASAAKRTTATTERPATTRAAAPRRRAAKHAEAAPMQQSGESAAAPN